MSEPSELPANAGTGPDQEDAGAGPRECQCPHFGHDVEVVRDFDRGFEAQRQRATIFSGRQRAVDEEPRKVHREGSATQDDGRDEAWNPGSIRGADAGTSE